MHSQTHDLKVKEECGLCIFKPDRFPLKESVKTHYAHSVKHKVQDM